MGKLTKGGCVLSAPSSGVVRENGSLSLYVRLSTRNMNYMTCPGWCYDSQITATTSRVKNNLAFGQPSQSSRAYLHCPNPNLILTQSQQPVNRTWLIKSSQLCSSLFQHSVSQGATKGAVIASSAGDAKGCSDHRFRAHAPSLHCPIDKSASTQSQQSV